MLSPGGNHISKKLRVGTGGAGIAFSLVPDGTCNIVRRNRGNHCIIGIALVCRANLRMAVVAQQQT